jgi:zinc D-Ala-D-Ala carboxypeptidase
MNLSKHLTLEIATKSNTARRMGIDNTPGQAELENLKAYGRNIYDMIVENYGLHPHTHTIFRVPELNKQVKGDKYSQHMRGEAGDHDFDNYENLTNSDLFYWIVENLTFDRIIWEYGNFDNPKWVHVSHSRVNRRQIGIKTRNTQYVYFTRLSDFEDFKKQLYTK